MNTGEVVVGEGETLVTGDAVNVAARLEQCAGTGQILVGSATEQLVRGHVELEEVEALTVKGKTLPVPAHLVIGVPDARGEEPLHASPLVGREKELALLEEALRLAREKRVPQLATVVGAPGVGKSRIVAELLGRSSARILVGRCLSYGDGITYWPVNEILAELGDLASVVGDDAVPVGRRWRRCRELPRATASPEEIAWAFRRVLESLSRDELVVVALEDIHWAEPALLDLIEYVATFAQDSALVLLCTARPELFDVQPTWTTPRPNATLVQLDRCPQTTPRRSPGSSRPCPRRARSASSRPPTETRCSWSSWWRSTASHSPPTSRSRPACRRCSPHGSTGSRRRSGWSSSALRSRDASSTAARSPRCCPSGTGRTRGGTSSGWYAATSSGRTGRRSAETTGSGSGTS